MKEQRKRGRPRKNPVITIKDATSPPASRPQGYAARAHQYCLDIISGRIPAGKYVRLACQRHLNDIERSKSPDYPYTFNPLLTDKAGKQYYPAEKRCAFTELLPHVKGKWRGQKIKLELHQIFIESCIWGWVKKKNGKRRFSLAMIELPRKNGKSVEAATAGLYMLVEDGELGAEIYSGATTEKQALEVFRPAWQMVHDLPAFRDYYGIKLSGTPKNPTSIYRESDMSRFELLVGNPGDGASPHCAIIDEYHEHKTSTQLDTMETGMGSREQPLALVITTAGTDTSTPCYDLHLKVIKILEGVFDDDSVFAIIFHADVDDDVRNISTWKKANPNYLVSIEEDYLPRKLRETITDVTKQNINYCKHLNRWSNAGIAWMNMTKWEACCDPTLNLDQFHGQPCYAAVDLATKIDICALVLLYFGKEIIAKRMVWDENEQKEVESEVITNNFIVFGKYYLPEETIELPGNEHFKKWVDQGHIISTPGARTDFLYIEDDLKKIHSQTPIIELAYDPREATYLINNVSQWLGSQFIDGKDQSRCVEITQGPALISEPMKEVEARIYDRTLLHNGDPVMTWMMGNVVKKKGRNSGPIKSYYPTKEKNEFKIDGPMCIIMATGRAMLHNLTRSIYDGRTKDQLKAMF